MLVLVLEFLQFHIIINIEFEKIQYLPIQRMLKTQKVERTIELIPFFPILQYSMNNTGKKIFPEVFFSFTKCNNNEYWQTLTLFYRKYQFLI